jgi:HAD superfamily hydrolase (TIGR01484 family)
VACEGAVLLLCSDLDGTLIPDGRAPESPNARPLFRRLARHPGVCLAYATGRDPALVDRALEETGLPEPRLLLGDVGSSIYIRADGRWVLVEDYWAHIAADWRGRLAADVIGLLQDVAGLSPQEPAKQAPFKASFYAAPGADARAVIAEARVRLDRQALQSSVIWSVDADGRTGLLDVLPASADKRQAIRFLRDWLSAPPGRTVFAGDSGNDLAVLGTEIPSVLVGNAEPSVRAAARAAARAAGYPDRLYLASGGYREMNGNYAAGVLEGLVHFVPEADGWLDEVTPE